MGEVRRHKPFRLSDKAYRKLCMLVDERDEGCVICGNPAVEHHHIILDLRVGRTGWRILSPCAMSTTNFAPMG